MSTIGALFICLVVWSAIMTIAAFFFGAAVVREQHERRSAPRHRAPKRIR